MALERAVEAIFFVCLRGFEFGFSWLVEMAWRV